MIRKDVELWPLIRRELFTKEQALTIFDRIFDAYSTKGN